jgi:hypoxanthine phosphoribosyltransferase
MASVDRTGQVVLREVRSRQEVHARVRELVARIAAEYAGRPPLLVAIAEGAHRFAAELRLGLEAAGLPAELAMLRAWRTQGTRLRRVRVEPVDVACFTARDVLVVDDIADEGRTLQTVLGVVRRGRPRTLRTAVLVSKGARRRVDVKLDYVGFEIDDGWVVGCGMDLDGAFRDLDFLAVAEPGA